MKIFNKLSIITALVVLVSCSSKDEHGSFSFQFDPQKEISGKTFAIKDINPDLPADWDEYSFLVMEYKISTSQRFQLGFTTDSGIVDIRVMSYVPGAWNRIAFPLKYFTDLPDAAVDFAATYNHPRYTGWANLRGRIGPLHGVDSVGVRMHKPIGNPTIEIRSLSLAKEDPGDMFLEDTPAIDRFGQQIRLDYKEKVKDEAELKSYWDAEDAIAEDNNRFGYSKYGGYLKQKREATGYFRLTKENGRWWFVDPEGYLFLSVGVDCVSAGNGGLIRDYDKRSNMYEAVPAEDFLIKTDRDGRKTYSLGEWNLYRRYGEGYKQKANENIIRRMDRWGLNTIANWSDEEVIKMQKKAFVASLHGLGMKGELMGLCDVYAPEYKENLQKNISMSTEKLKDNPWLLGYFVGNEPAWINQEVLLCKRILEGSDRPIKVALEEYLSKKGDTDDNRRQFVLESFKTFLTDVNGILKKCDPNHLNLGIRFAEPNTVPDDLLAICGEGFDVFSFNSYSLTPNHDMLDRTERITGLPMIIGEFHFGTVDRGLAQSLWQVNSEHERGVAYRYYVEQAFSHPALIGTGYFQWADQDITGRFDGENYNCGLVDVTDRPYPEMTDAVAESSMRLFDVHSGSVEPFSEIAENARGDEYLPDVWNQ